MTKNKYLDPVEEIINLKVLEFNDPKIPITNKNEIPLGNFQLSLWYKIPDIICVYVDIRGSTKLSANTNDKNTASIYELFTGTAVRIFHEFGASYIDIKGDGVFALFNRNQAFRSFAAAVSFKTFANEKFKPLANKKLEGIDVGFHMAIDQETVLVKQIGIKDDPDRDSRKNEVWAGKPINLASKLSSRSKDNELWVSERFFNRLGSNELVIKSCGCKKGTPSDSKNDLWEMVDVTEDENFDFNKAYILKTVWCEIHGKKWCEDILKLDSPS